MKVRISDDAVALACGADAVAAAFNAAGVELKLTASDTARSRPIKLPEYWTAAPNRLAESKITRSSSNKRD
jgi:hypothetical protein